MMIDFVLLKCIVTMAPFQIPKNFKIQANLFSTSML
jgi:hypothetical protein